MEDMATCFLILGGFRQDKTPVVSVNGVAPPPSVDLLGTRCSVFEVPSWPIDSTGNPDIKIECDVDKLGTKGHYFESFTYEGCSGHVFICRPITDAISLGFNPEITKIGHRGCGEDSKGYVTGYTENTLASFLEAAKLGAHAIELDVHLTTDGVVVVHHDDRIGGKLIREMEHAEFLDAVSALVRQDAANGSFDSLLAALPDSLGINIELKNSTSDLILNTTTEYLAALSEATIQAVQQHPRKRVVFSSFSPLLCAYTKIRAPQSTVLLLLANTGLPGILSVAGLTDTLLCFTDYVQLNGVVLDTECNPWPETLIATMHRTERMLYCYGQSTNIPAGVDKLLEEHFNGVITDNLPGISYIP